MGTVFVCCGGGIVAVILALMEVEEKWKINVSVALNKTLVRQLRHCRSKEK